jgi:hypothetical protein
MIVIARNNHDLTPDKRPSELLEERPRGGKRVAARTVAQLEHIAKQNQSIDVLERVDQSGAGPWTAQNVGARAGTEMQI